MTYAVQVGRLVMERAANLYGPRRGAAGEPSEYDFVAGPLARSGSRDS